MIPSVSGRGSVMCVSLNILFVFNNRHMLSGVWFDVYSLLCHSPSPAPPLTFDNLYSVLEEVKEEWRDLSRCLDVGGVAYNQHDSHEAALKNVVERYLQQEHNRRPRRRVIWALDMIRKVHVADKIMSFAEPVQGGCGYLFTVLCVLVTGFEMDIILCVFVNRFVKQWCADDQGPSLCV